eukprot:TRINITY_DN17638_c0_g1_i1.p1 TRINITY_DN17638_c0_g1~~TRINITY_DN17638_c0_g1_i1.p1  ORF type:complete len:435 (-),score=70.83 TRINITY_DN17638_c0_g1_i1:314-1618(-)
MARACLYFPYTHQQLRLLSSETKLQKQSESHGFQGLAPNTISAQFKLNPFSSLCSYGDNYGSTAGPLGFPSSSFQQFGRFVQPKRRKVLVISGAVQSDAATLPPLPQLTATEPLPARRRVTAFAPATCANLGPGFDFLGCAVEGLGDYVTAEVADDIPAGTVVIKEIVGDGGKLSLIAENNCIGIAAMATMELLGARSVGVALSLRKGLPLGSGLGSSAASAAAAAAAVNSLFGSPLSKDDLVQAGLRSEASVSGYHADNVAPALLGGFILIRSYDPLDLIRLQFPEGKELFFVLVSPVFEAPTKAMRAALPAKVSMKSHIANSSQAGALVAAILTGDVALLGAAAASDVIVEPRRGPLIPGSAAVKVAASSAGAFGCTISGAGPTCVAFTDSREKGEIIGQAMCEAFRQQGKLQASATVVALDRVGARVVEEE